MIKELTAMFLQSKNNVVDLTAFREKTKAPTAQQEEALQDVEWHVELARWILARCLERPDIPQPNPREMEFLQSMMYWPGLPTKRQAWWLEKIETRVLRALDGTATQPPPTPPAA
jgi:hypothetical protein